ncbi:ABC transporter ATP-binding protein [Reinekea thalattae]|uniref:ABC transporter ATP-binding protein n=1 Tax=Reinekea thalattae TaxID=2593301 RepID=UPI001650790C|nr:ABC transporter ATP-binding protein [Reinekea thalattae]
MNTHVEHKNRFLLNLIQQKKWYYLGSVLSVGLASYFLYLVPTIGRIAIDQIVSDSAAVDGDLTAQLFALFTSVHEKPEQLLMAGLAIVLVTAFAGLFMYLKDYLAATACEDTIQTLRNRLFEHLHKLDERYLSKADSGDLVQRCTSDIDTLREFLTLQVMNIGRTVVLALIMVPLMFMQHVWMSVLSLFLVPVVIYFACTFYVRIRGLFQQVDDAEGELTTIVQENLTGIRVVRAFARQQHECDKFDHYNRKYSDLNYRLLCMLANFWSTADILCFCQNAILLFGGGWLVVNDYVSIGTYFAFIGYINMLIWPIRQLGEELSEAGKATVAINRIQQILDAPEEVEQQSLVDLPDDFTADIEFDSVSFSFDQQKPALNNVSFKVAAGETIAIVGPTGAGKSTLIQLLMRLQDYQQGSITVGGIELNRIARQQIRQRISTLLQEPFLFSRSLRDNIKLGHKLATDEQMVTAASDASVHHTIKAFKQGYQTLIGERGVSLSGGQKQRVTLSRTLLKKAKMLVLDDTLSAVDSDTEHKIISALHKKRGEQTLLIITHRISVCQQADRIFVMQDGCLVDSGSHQALLSRPGFYQQLWQIQADQQQAADQPNLV